MSPVYEEDGKWWFDVDDGTAGPFDDEASAMKAYQSYPRKNCSTCEE